MKIFRRITAAAVVVFIAVQFVFAVPTGAINVTDYMYNRKYTLVTDILRKDTETLDAVKALGKTVVFISVSDVKHKAKVFYAKSKELNNALYSAFTKARASGIVPKWFKTDIVVSEETVTYRQFCADNRNKYIGSMRSGIAFSSDYSAALLEAQINSAGMVDSENTGKIDFAKVNAELSAMGRKTLKTVPSKLLLFRTQGYFAENTAYAMKLENGTFATTGRRILPADRDTAEMLAQKSSGYLSSICGEDGKFVYGYYPIDNEPIEGYNMLRHAGTVWNLIMQYEMCGDESLVPVIERSLAYLGKSVVYKDEKTAFINDGTALNIGGNGLALLAYTTYSEVFCTNRYNALIRALACGIMYMQKSDGSFTHTLNKYTYKTAEDYIVIYYDGEAAYGLAKAYGVLGDERFLKSAKKAADFFIKKHYEKEHSHWISYTFNELTKYAPEEKYFEFGLRNVNEDDFSSTVHNTRAGINSASETMNAAFEMYDRLISSGKKCAYLDEFNAKQLLRAVIRRAEYGLNYFMFPEYAMYFKAPETIVYGFAVREDNFRTRIDDIQHFMDGYYMFWKNYDVIESYKDTLL